MVFPKAFVQTSSVERRKSCYYELQKNKNERNLNLLKYLEISNKFQLTLS